MRCWTIDRRGDSFPPELYAGIAVTDGRILVPGDNCLSVPLPAGASMDGDRVVCIPGDGHLLLVAWVGGYRGTQYILCDGAKPSVWELDPDRAALLGVDVPAGWIVASDTYSVSESGRLGRGMVALLRLSSDFGRVLIVRDGRLYGTGAYWVVYARHDGELALVRPEIEAAERRAAAALARVD